MSGPAIRVTLTPLLGFPEVLQGDDVAALVLHALQHTGIQLAGGDILVVSSKIASKAMGLRAPSGELAAVVASQTVSVTALLDDKIARVTSIVESAAGPVMAAGGVDASNTADHSSVLILPDDPDAVAAQIRAGLQTGWARLWGAHLPIGVILSGHRRICLADRPAPDFAGGFLAGIHVLDDLRGSSDADGRTLAVTQRCLADEIAAAADLVKGKASGIPAAHIRGPVSGPDGREPIPVPGIWCAP